MNLQRFSSNARNTLALAQHEAAKLRHDHVGTEHLLLGLLGVAESGAAAILRDMGIRPDHVRREIINAVGYAKATPLYRLQFTWRAQQVMHYAVLAARPRKPYRRLDWGITTAHLLLGIVLDGEDLAIRVLRDLGANPEKLQTRIKHALHHANRRLVAGTRKLP